jgi:hypothetical protein
MVLDKPIAVDCRSPSGEHDFGHVILGRSLSLIAFYCRGCLYVTVLDLGKLLQEGKAVHAAT